MAFAGPTILRLASENPTQVKLPSKSFTMSRRITLSVLEYVPYLWIPLQTANDIITRNGLSLVLLLSQFFLAEQRTSHDHMPFTVRVCIH